jgi:hypothetical protein
MYTIHIRFDKSPDSDDSIFIGINRLVAKGLIIDGQEKGTDSIIQYPCQIVNRFQCPYEMTNTKEDDVEAGNSNINVDNLFRLYKMAFLVEIALAKARKDDSEIQIKDKQDLLHALADRYTLLKILEQADDTCKDSEHLREITAEQDNNYIIDYFTRMKDNIDLNELRFY